MGTVIEFPSERRPTRAAGPVPPDGGSIVILPVVRVERTGDDPSDGLAPQTGASSGGGRRRPGRRS